MTKGKEIPRTKKLVKRISELNSLGVGPHQIANQINKELRMNINANIVSRIIKRGAVLTGRFLKSDKRTTDFYKEVVVDLINKVRKNMEILEESRQIILDKLDKLKEDLPESKLMEYTSQINAQIRTQNDSIRTMNENLKRIESQATEVTVSVSQQVYQTLQILKELEAQDYININPEYYKSDLYKQFKETEKKEE